jgi:acetylornithine deacetylase
MEWNEKKKSRAHFENEDHPINLNRGKIEGGDWASSVPAWCRIDCRISIYPAWNAEDASHMPTANSVSF